MPTTITGNSAAFPANFPVASDGDAPNAIPSIQLGFQAVADQTANLQLKKANLLSPTFTGVVQIAAGQILQVAGGGGEIIMFSGSYFVNLGQTRYRAPVRPTFVASPGHVTVDTTQGDIFIMPYGSNGNGAGATGNEMVRLRTSTVPVPLVGERITICNPGVDAAGPAPLASGKYWTVQREDATVIASLYNDDTGVSALGVPSSVTCEFAGGVWRAVGFSGEVVPGPGW